jgi:hypothetical protein
MDRVAVTLLDHIAPERQGIDAGVWLKIGPQRADDAAFGIAGASWLEPRVHAFFQIGDDPIIDPRVKVFA